MASHPFISSLADVTLTEIPECLFIDCYSKILTFWYVLLIIDCFGPYEFTADTHRGSYMY